MLHRLFAAVFVAGLSATSAAPAAPLPAPAPVAALIGSVDIPHSDFTLANGLRVIVHTDRKAPIVAVSVWYHIGSKDEPAGKTGFAHLFEHLMFYGSENNDGVFFKKLEDVGATDSNGTTFFDRTNYFENVPTPALDLALFLESDRMGHLLGAVTQAKLDAQRAVVQNEKRQRDNAPYGLASYKALEGVFPAGHPYRHSPIGSMADLEAASLADVHGWFRAHYGPNNAVLVLAGDIDAATARPLVERYFGDIPAGPPVRRFDTPVPVWTATRRETLYDQVPTARIGRNYIVPGRPDPVTPLVDIAATVLAGGNSSRLYNDLVRDRKLAVDVSGGAQGLEKASFVSIDVDVAPGVDPAVVDRRVDELVAAFLKDGPTADEVGRVASRAVAGTIRGLEAVGGDGGKAVTLAEGAVYAGDPDFYKTELKRYADATPATVLAAARTWLARGDYRQFVLPGKRPPAETTVARPAPPAPPPIVNRVARMPEPKVTGVAALTLPPVERATLANGLKVELSRRTTVPQVRMLLSFDAGFGADDRVRLGIQGLTLNLLDEGAGDLDGPRIAEAKERLGAGIGGSASLDRTRLTLDALKPNLAASVALFADIVQRPRFEAAEIERVRGQILAGIAQEQADPGGAARRLLPVLLYGPAHPYGVPGSGSGTPDGVKAATRADILRWYKAWIRPDNATLFVVGDVTMAELKPLLDASFGGWRPDPAVAKGSKSFPPVAVPAAARIVLIDRPGSPQSYIRGGIVLPVKGTDDPLALRMANDALGQLSTSRLSMDIREAKGWAYGVGTPINDARDRLGWFVIAPVQTDRTGDTIAAMRAEIAAFTAARPIDQTERDKTVFNTIRSLPGDFESGGALLAAIEKNALYGRGDNYYTRLAGRLEALTPADLNAAAKVLSTDRMIWVVVGDRTLVAPQLAKLGLPVEVRTAR